MVLKTWIIGPNLFDLHTYVCMPPDFGIVREAHHEDAGKTNLNSFEISRFFLCEIKALYVSSTIYPVLYYLIAGLPEERGVSRALRQRTIRQCVTKKTLSKKIPHKLHV